MSGHHQSTHDATYQPNTGRSFDPSYTVAAAAAAAGSGGPPLPESSRDYPPRNFFHPFAESTEPRGVPRAFHDDQTFAPLQHWAEPSSSQQGHFVQRPPQQHPSSLRRQQHHPYASLDHAKATLPHQTPHHPLSNVHALQTHVQSGAGHGALFAEIEAHGTRQVSRAACLSCRSAKRKCDGVKPVCGPCAQRGVQGDAAHPDGACVYVASKRGGPRFKGIRGREATKKVLNERERLRMEEEERAMRERGRQTASFSPEAASSADASGFAASHHGSSRSRDSAPASTSLTSVSTRPHITPDGGVSPGSDLPSLYSRVSSETVGPISPQTPLTPASSRDASAGAVPSPNVFAFGNEKEALFQSNYFREPHGGCGGLFDDLSVANLEMWQNLQGEQASAADVFANFYKKLESLPKAGVLGASGNNDEPIIDDFDVQSANVDVTEASKKAAAVNSEQQTRALLSDYYELVYPGCPVMLPSGHLSSLAFHLSDDDSSALLAAISSCVALQLPQSEVHRIVRGSMHLTHPDDKEANAGLGALEGAPREEIALFHAKSAERLLLKKVVQLARGSDALPEGKKGALGGLHQASLSSTFAPDLELVRIKLIATHVLLAHYYYGITEQKRAFHHATQAWTHCQSLDLDARGAAPAAPSWFSSTQKSEWAKRAFWASYTAATVMSCTGGFNPLAVKRDAAEDLSLLPGADQELASWKVLVKGAQFVSRAYATLFDLEAFKKDPAHELIAGQPQPRQHQQKWEEIFSRMQGLDNDVMNYVRRDPAWSDRTCFEVTVIASRRTALFDDENDTRLKRSLRIAGKLMTSGALIILHRTQAFANAKIFVAPTCGLPGTFDDSSEGSASTDSMCGSRQPDESAAVVSSGATPRQAHASDDNTSARKHEQRPSSEQMSDRAAKRVRTRPGRSLSNSSRSSSSSDSGGGNSTSGSGAVLRVKKIALTRQGIPVSFAGGPFEPMVSLERCRFAASVMYTELPNICGSTFQHGRRESMGLLPVEGLNLGLPAPISRDEWSAPSLPPFSACSLVLAAYVFLMETLHAQLSAGGSAPLDAMLLQTSKSLEVPFLLNADPDRVRQLPQLRGTEALQLAVRLRHAITEIEHALQKFSRAWEVAKNYVQEVRILLEVNNGLFPMPA
ncbi:uncharacterized protein PFL1_00533 [Pseudozyma flocculosa PF-1]|uniref:Zn(2)-C6 fungal-type domain-containing protein n=1 Tax=Pseudozyma flocculosa TaxID=84751 RepID=A0A5C3EQW0_9BASI|nr:uncharacterized protein PFL1_00533 [Pseudozyma flocculosa PF-1]EPQ32337.1 hypothetical protein PFL1_00533 [Pseudozyma flocculosa PF-1]SPO34703.1 uncharacterized protein PSFLO_00174 [Pseudozyma flocculosa]